MSVSPERSIAGKVALVTGAANGMGAATATLMAREGASVAVIDRDAAGIAGVVDAIVAAGGTARGWTLDLADHAAIAGVVTQAAEHFGALDIVVNNAGIAAMGVGIEDDGYDAMWDKIVAINLTAHQRVVRAALPWLRRSDSARIVNISSTEGLGASPRDTHYAASKAGVIGLTRALAVDLGKEQITVNAICPGPIHTPMTSFVDDGDKAAFARVRTALRRYGRPEEVAHMTLSLCLPAASYVTGAIIPVDGGLTARNG
ncbi:SDR family NAD(P)-dependent oxidoreductase [Sphingomonas adhaesiva]|uniref:SDR family NAD(P)-dependent oxidoreductase n=1 Tax=Sphingomonas adhaesiva TaxID=28212 RepID=UPI002FF6EEFC